MAADVRAFPINYWDGFTAEDSAEYFGLEKGLHANAAETSAVLAINPALVDIDRANAEFPPFPKFTVNSGPVHTAFFFTTPGSVFSATRSGTWGDARDSYPELGERYLEAGVRSTIAVLDNIETDVRGDAEAGVIQAKVQGSGFKVQGSGSRFGNPEP